MECKLVVRKWVIHNGYNIWFKKFNKRQLKGHCLKGCEWRLYGIMLAHEHTIVIKALIDKHI